MRKLVKILCAALTLVSVGLGDSRAETSQAIDSKDNLCAGPIQRWERSLGIPPHLLEAISLAESGRWEGKGSATIAWPWTVTSGKDGQFHDSKDEAIGAVRKFQARKVANVDVGCMQINLLYHPNAFENLGEAFDPERNVAYAARYLAKLYGVHESWTEAAAAYHSTTPVHNNAYKVKIIALWNDVRTEHASEPRSRTREFTPRTTPHPVPAFARARPVDTARTGELNRRLRETRARVRATEQAANALHRRVELRRQQLAEWRENRTGSLDLAHMGAMRRAEMELRRKQILATDRPSEGLSLEAYR